MSLLTEIKRAFQGNSLRCRTAPSIDELFEFNFHDTCGESTVDPMKEEKKMAKCEQIGRFSIRKNPRTDAPYFVGALKGSDGRFAYLSPDRKVKGMWTLWEERECFSGENHGGKK